MRGSQRIGHIAHRPHHYYEGMVNIDLLAKADSMLGQSGRVDASLISCSAQHAASRLARNVLVLDQQPGYLGYAEVRNPAHRASVRGGGSWTIVHSTYSGR